MWARVALLAVVIPLLLAGMTTPAYATGTEDALSAWTVPEEGATVAGVPESFPNETTHLFACTRGHRHGWTLPDGTSTYLLWAQCQDPGTAADFLRSYRWSNGYAPLEVPAALAEGAEILATPISPGVVRMWVQGSYALVLETTTCAADRDCAATSAEWARDVAALSADTPSVLTPSTPVDGDPLDGWSPGVPGWSLTRGAPPTGHTRGECDAGATQQWVGEGGSKLEVWWTRCDNAARAFTYRDTEWRGAGATAAFASVFPQGQDLAVEQVDPVTGHPLVLRSWVQGSTFVNLYLSCPGDAAGCATTSGQLALSVAERLPGQVQSDTRGLDSLRQAGWLLLGGPLVGLLLLLVPSHVVHWRRSRGWAVGPHDPRFTRVDGMVRPVRVGRVLRRLLVTVLSLLSWYGIMMATGGRTDPWVAIPGFLGFFVLFPLWDLLLRLVWRRHPLITLGRTRAAPTLLGVAGAVLRSVSAAVAAVALLVYGVAALLVVSDFGKLSVDVEAEIQAGFESGNPLLWLFSAVHWAGREFTEAGAAPALFVLVLLPITAAYFVDRLGRRLAQRSMGGLLRDDDRPPFVYLRGFDEDQLRMQTSAGRQGFLEIFTPFGRPRFEEVLVRYLSLYGPVVAISPRRQRIPDLGAAKVTVSDDAWQDQVRSWVGSARAVVMAATPGEVRAGLTWEMKYVSSRAEELHIVLVLAPWPRAELHRRWEGFVAHARDIPPFSELAERPFPDGVQVLTWSAAHGWRGYGASRRWDWTYAASIITAVRNGDLGDGTGPVPEPPALQAVDPAAHR